MSGVADVMGLSTIMRKAIKLIKGIEIRKKANTIVVGVFSVVTWFKLSERYNMDGSISVCSRRDFRLGGHRGRLVAHDANRLSMYFTWDNPYAGDCRHQRQHGTAVWHAGVMAAENGSRCNGSRSCFRQLLALCAPAARIISKTPPRLPGLAHSAAAAPVHGRLNEVLRALKRLSCPATAHCPPLMLACTGEGSDDLILVSPDELHMVSTVTAKKTGTFTYTTIYRKDRTP